MPKQGGGNSLCDCTALSLPWTCESACILVLLRYSDVFPSHRDRLTEALQTYTSLPAHYAPHMWTSLETFMLSRAIDTHAELERPQDREWIHILLSFLKAFVESLGDELLMHEADKSIYVSRLVTEMHTAAEALDAGNFPLPGAFRRIWLIYLGELFSDIVQPDHPALTIRVANEAKVADAEDGSFLDITIHNHLPCVSDRGLCSLHVFELLHRSYRSNRSP